MSAPSLMDELVAAREKRDAADRIASGDPIAAAALSLETTDDAVVSIRRALLEDAQDTRDAGDGPAREAIPGTGDLLHRGVAAVFFSERGADKTTAVLAASVGGALAGEKVLYLDRENGAALTRDRIDAILEAGPGDHDPLGTGRFVGRHYP